METEIAGFHPLAVALLSALTAAFLIMGVLPRIRRKPDQDGSDDLERRLRAAIPDPASRERLLQDALRRTGGDRARAIRTVLDDLAGDRR
jgi:hypothetical protein